MIPPPAEGCHRQPMPHGGGMEHMDFANQYRCERDCGIVPPPAGHQQVVG